MNGVKKALPTVKRRPKHMAAMDWRDLPDFMADLSEREDVSTRTLEFLILTASRSGEARGARWDEIEGDVWAIPAERMKRGVEHRIPLAPDALAVLNKVRGLDPEFVFPSVQRGEDGKAKTQSVMVFKGLLKRMGRTGFTVHGFRSTFLDWCSESARADREVAEATLSHTTGNEVERAYARSDLFERRQLLMKKWAEFATGRSAQITRLVCHA